MRIFRTDVQPSWITGWILSSILFVALIGGYFTASYLRHLENPGDSVIPTVTQLWNAAHRVVTDIDPSTDQVWLWPDLKATAWRFGWSLFICSFGVFIGLFMALFGYFEKLMFNFITFMDLIVALTLLPILMLLFGIEEGFRIGLVVFGVMPTIIMAAYGEAKSIPMAVRYKAQSLGASEFEVTWNVVMPLILPRMIDHLRLNYKAIASLVVAGEMIVASVGVAYRINSVRRYMSMDVVYVYVVIFTALLFLFNRLTAGVNRLAHPWYGKS